MKGKSRQNIRQLIVLCLVIGMVWVIDADRHLLRAHESIEDATPNASGATLHDLFAKGEFTQVLQAIEQLETPIATSFPVRRLKMLSLALLGKTSEGIEEYERFVDATHEEHEPLLREFAIACILPFRADMREQIRGAAYTALKEIGTDDVIPFLEEGYTDGSGMIRALVVEGLGQFPAGFASKAVRQALDDQAAWVRATAIKVLGRTGNKAMVDLIEPRLKDKQAMVQVTAAGALIMLGKPQYWARIEQAVQSDEGYERGAAIRMLGELQDIRALPLLTASLKDPQPSIRVAAAAALGKLGSSEAIPYLAEALATSIATVRAAAAVNLGKLQAKQAMPALKRALRDRDPGVQTAAIDALLRLNVPFAEVAPIVRQLLHSQNPKIRSGLAKALAHGRGQAVVDTLAILLHDPIPSPRISAARSLGRIGGREVLSLLKQALRDSNEAVRATAAGAIARILSKQAQT